jgi:hypothetical protein
MDEPGTPANRHDVPDPYPACDAETGACCAAADDLAALRQAERDAAIGDAIAVPARDTRAMIPQETLVPFVVQSGQRIYMLACENGAWVLAELQFDDERVTFIETRRASFEWPREAFGALLSRVALREVDNGAVDHVAADFHNWLGGQFIAH